MSPASVLHTAQTHTFHQFPWRPTLRDDACYQRASVIALSMKREAGSPRIETVLFSCAVFLRGIMTFKHQMTESETDPAPLSALADPVPVRFIIVKGFIHFLQCSLETHFKSSENGIIHCYGSLGWHQAMKPTWNLLVGLGCHVPHFSNLGNHWWGGPGCQSTIFTGVYSTCISFFQYFEMKTYLRHFSLTFLPSTFRMFPTNTWPLFLCCCYIYVCMHKSINTTCSVHSVLLVYLWFRGWPFGIDNSQGLTPGEGYLSWSQLSSVPVLCLQVGPRELPLHVSN